MEPEIVAAISAAISLLAATIAAGFKLLFKRMDTVFSEFKPNGGSSIKDQISRLERRVDELYHILSERK